MDGIRARLQQRTTGPHAKEYRSIAEKLEMFAGTTYPVTRDGAEMAALDLVALVQSMKHVDDVGGEQWADLEIELHGRRRTPAPTALLTNPATALQDVLSEAYPKRMSLAVDDLSKFTDSLVDRLSYRNLRDDPATQRALGAELVRELRRMALLLPKKASTGSEFLAKLVEYVNSWLL